MGWALIILIAGWSQQAAAHYRVKVGFDRENDFWISDEKISCEVPPPPPPPVPVPPASSIVSGTTISPELWIVLQSARELGETSGVKLVGRTKDCCAIVAYKSEEDAKRVYEFLSNKGLLDNVVIEFTNKIGEFQKLDRIEVYATFDDGILPTAGQPIGKSVIEQLNLPGTPILLDPTFAIGIVSVKPTDLVKLLKTLDGVTKYKSINNEYILSQSEIFSSKDEYLWNLKCINASAAWTQIQDTGRDIIVAVIDTGVDYHFPTMQDAMWMNVYETENNNEDDDGNGYVDDVYGFDFYDCDNDPMDEHGHGTLCAGVILSVAGSHTNTGMARQKIKIMALKICDYKGDVTEPKRIAKAIEYAVCNKADVINCSWGGRCADDQDIRRAIEFAMDKGVLVVAAAGNGHGDNDMYPIFPACFKLKNIISVLSIDGPTRRTDLSRLSRMSNYGEDSVDIGAPGRGILSTDLSHKLPGEDKRRTAYSTASGTSMAAAHVSGAATLVMRNSRPPYCGSPAMEAGSYLLDNACKANQLKGKCQSNGILNLSFLDPDHTKRRGLLRYAKRATLRTDAGTLELDFGGNEHFIKLARRLNGRPVIVTGKLEICPSLEVLQQKIIRVTSLGAAPPKR